MTEAAPAPDLSIGEVRVNAIRLVVGHADVEVWEIDCRSKRPDYWAASFDDDDLVVELVAGPATTGLDPDKPGVPTAITFRGRGEWHSMMESRRYTVRVVLWHPP